MTERPPVRILRLPGGEDSPGHGLPALLTAYHLRTEDEKGLAVTDPAALPHRHLSEIRSPATVFADDLVLIARLGGRPAGCAILTAPGPDGHAEMKRLWTTPECRGAGVASALIGESLAAAEESGVRTLRLTVWSWREGAIALYRRHGFAVAASWDERPGLVCMERPVPDGARPVHAAADTSGTWPVGSQPRNRRTARRADEE
ncbi:GNAT family N-acetyltransferase [Streptomyces sp. NBC_01218]|uniref:GNAT family N-acetyltransferase n=1 Tax=Streptomyces sp. NBC_01218 TaxID=2903780 RepID=UPI002E0F304D